MFSAEASETYKQVSPRPCHWTNGLQRTLSAVLQGLDAETPFLQRSLGVSV